MLESLTERSEERSLRAAEFLEAWPALKKVNLFRHEVRLLLKQGRGFFEMVKKRLHRFMAKLDESEKNSPLFALQEGANGAKFIFLDSTAEIPPQPIILHSDLGYWLSVEDCRLFLTSNPIDALINMWCAYHVFDIKFDSTMEKFFNQ